MTMREWRIATRRRGVRHGWDIGQTSMLSSVAMDKAVEFNQLYPEYEHRAITVPVPGGLPKGVPPRSPDLGKRS